MNDEIKVIDRSDRVEALLAPYEGVIGADLPGYRNHVYRAVTYAMHFLGNDAQYAQIVETAFVYHDIGLWTDKELAYLEPSEAVALADNAKHGWGLDPELLRAAIHWHHKAFRYKGPHEKVVEACRKADWIDASQGRLRKGLSKGQIKRVEGAIPNKGFHKALIRLSKDYGGSLIMGGFRVTRGIVKL